MDLDDYFAFGADEPYQRHEVFTDREEYTQLLLSRADELARERLSVDDLQNFRRPAHNVVVVHGEGGVGKTTLVNRFCSLLTGDDDRTAPRRVVVSFEVASSPRSTPAWPSTGSSSTPASASASSWGAAAS